jgi:beta-lactamase regulating signal transducer with metallopeptidase domain
VAAFLLSDLLRLAWIYFGLRSARPHRVAIGTDFVHVILTAGKSSPYVLGLFRPQVIVPRQLLQLLAPADLQAVIAHELAHIHARDLLWAWPEWILRRVLFYHPLMWWASYRHSEAKEICADWQAMSWLGLSPRQYGQSLLALLQCADGAVAAPLTARAVSGLRRLQRRLGWIEAGPRPLSLWSRGLGAAAVVASFVAGLAQARTTGPAMRAGMCVQRQHELLLESVLNLRADPKTCEQGENEK